MSGGVQFLYVAGVGVIKLQSTLLQCLHLQETHSTFQSEKLIFLVQPMTLHLWYNSVLRQVF